MAVADYVPLWSIPTTADGAAASDLGVAAGQTPMAARVYLAGRDPVGLAAYAKAVSAPGNPLYQRYLTPSQEEQRFGPAADQTAAVRSWLTSAGLRVTAATAHYVEVTGTVAQGTHAFGVSWHSYRVGKNPVTQYGEPVARVPQQAPIPGASVTVPTALAAAVTTVVPIETGIPGYLDSGETTSTGDVRVGSVPPATSQDSKTPPCSDYFGRRVADTLPTAYGRHAPYATCGYTPQQLRSAYGVPTNLTGAGVSAAVVAGGHTASTAHDLATFAAGHGEPLSPGQFSEVLPTGVEASCETQGPMYSEDFADVEQVHAMAPAARLTDFAVKCDDDGQALPVLDAYSQIADTRSATVVSSAWNARYNEATMSSGLIAVYEQVFKRGAVEGVGYYVDSDDEGDDSSVSPTHTPTVSYPDSDPWATGVGGTTLAIGPDGGYEWEVPWGDDMARLDTTATGWISPPGAFLGGGGGGTSRLFTQPGYQHGVVPEALSHAGGAGGADGTSGVGSAGAPMRVVPDIAADASAGSGIRVGVTVPPTAGQPAAYREFAVAGTSCSVQLIAGMQADAEQAAGVPLGFANPALYARFGSGDYHDVTATPLGHTTPLDHATPLSATPHPRTRSARQTRRPASPPPRSSSPSDGTRP
ncbi:S53 family peptidase [Catenulispora pinisilvae]|uniref:S53 family peptidase n=1 Tax=Catenulispora pinisilvae TaxID=2705253 RepID=UPI001891F6A8|nr:protease pro-enzyme activation domain-containing protein [Catenulispora pinisilvae]